MEEEEEKEEGLTCSSFGDVSAGSANICRRPKSLRTCRTAESGDLALVDLERVQLQTPRVKYRCQRSTVAAGLISFMLITMKSLYFIVDSEGLFQTKELEPPSNCAAYRSMMNETLEIQRACR